MGGVRVNDTFFLGGIEKADVLEILNAHSFFWPVDSSHDPATHGF